MERKLIRRVPEAGRNGRPGWLALGVFLALLALTTSPLAAQQGGWTVTPRLGLAIPTGGLAHVDYAGLNVGVGLDYWFQEHLALSFDGGYNRLLHREVNPVKNTPGLNMLNYTVGLEDVVLPGDGVKTWSLSLRAGVGATTFSSPEFNATGDPPTTFSHTYLTTALGLKAGYALTSGTTLYINTGLDWISVNKTDTQPLVDLKPLTISPFSSGMIIPLSIGVRTHF